jgi:hypothetical protein
MTSKTTLRPVLSDATFANLATGDRFQWPGIEGIEANTYKKLSPRRAILVSSEKMRDLTGVVPFAMKPTQDVKSFVRCDECGSNLEVNAHGSIGCVHCHSIGCSGCAHPEEKDLDPTLNDAIAEVVRTTWHGDDATLDTLHRYFHGPRTCEEFDALDATTRQQVKDVRTIIRTLKDRTQTDHCERLRTFLQSVATQAVDAQNAIGNTDAVEDILADIEEDLKRAAAHNAALRTF